MTTRRIAFGLDEPIWCGSPPGDERRIFIAEQSSGLIRVLRDGVLLPTPFVTVTNIASTGGERGLLGMTFHPRYATNGYFYVNYTRSGDGATLVDRYTVSNNPDLAVASSRVTILGPIAQPFSNHNGGQIAFGHDGYLYIGMGDGGATGDPSCYAQNCSSLLGKMLRIDVDSSFPYAIPTTNPFFGSTTCRQEIWSLGLRNPWRWSFDRLTGDLYIGDVGERGVEEIDFQPRASLGGENYGWKIMEGNNCYSNTACQPQTPACSAVAITRPIHTYTRTSGCAVTGGVVYRGCAIPDLRGTYFFGDNCSSAIWSFRYSGSVTQLQSRTTELAPGGGLGIGAPVHFGEDARGEILIIDYSGEVFKIVPRAPAPAIDLGFALGGSSNPAPELDVCGLLATGRSAELRLRFGPRNTVGLLCLSFANRPTPLFDGVLVPCPPELTSIVHLDHVGAFSARIPGGGGPFDLFMQCLVYDAALPQLVGFSNALRVSFQL
ncbi:MAG: PQQ-dependent sugar dehydrogenase [Planctomycetes bacterium]|nr:PQQ-dependent sugar dehydrogenase [Planctomycetota bacterium]